jgi:hypothetical protein
MPEGVVGCAGVTTPMASWPQVCQVGAVSHKIKTKTAKVLRLTSYVIF